MERQRVIVVRDHAPVTCLGDDARDLDVGFPAIVNYRPIDVSGVKALALGHAESGGIRGDAFALQPFLPEALDLVDAEFPQAVIDAGQQQNDDGQVEAERSQPAIGLTVHGRTPWRAALTDRRSRWPAA